MTVNSATSTASYTGNGVTQVFPVPFYFLVDTDLKVSRKLAAATSSTVLTLNSDYTLSGSGNSSGGSLTMLVAPATGDQLYIERNVVAVQQTAYPENNKFPAASHEKALDRLTMLAQQLLSRITFGLYRDPLGATYDLANNRLINSAQAVVGTDVPNLQQVQTLVIGGTSPVLVGPGGSGTVGYIQSYTGSVQRTVQDGLRDYISIKDFGGAPVTLSSAAFAAAYANVPTGATVRIPAGAWNFSTPADTGKLVFWEGDAVTITGASSTVDLPGIYSGNFNNGKIINKAHGQAGDTANLRIRRVADYTGGAVGYVNSALQVETTSQNGGNNYEWAGLFLLTNNRDSAHGNDVAMYAQSKKNSTGYTWAAVSELIDNTANPSTSSVTHEFDMRATGTDVSNNRICLQLNTTSTNGAGCEAAYGIKIGHEGNAAFRNAISVVGLNCTKIIDGTYYNLLQDGTQILNRSSAMSSSAGSLRWQIDGVDYGQVRLDAPGTMVFRVNGTDKFAMESGWFRSNADNAISLGTAANRWSTVYAGTGTINTSDERAKSGVTEIDDAVLDAWSEVNYAQFRFVDGTRLHTGVVAQRVRDSFAKHGIDPFAYGVLCHDQWEEVPAAYDEDGTEVSAARAAGDIYGVRYEEAQCLEAALVRRELEKLREEVARAIKAAGGAA
jgi:hypothetical protein